MEPSANGIVVDAVTVLYPWPVARGRETNWKGQASFSGASIKRMEKINAWNHERKLEQRGDDTIVFDAITTGNFGGFDVWLDDTAGASLNVETNLGILQVPLSAIGIEDVTMNAGGLERKIRAFRLPEENPHRAFFFSVAGQLALRFRWEDAY
jgi:hypothetical protein